MKKGMTGKVNKIWEWLVIDFERLFFTISTGRFSLQTKPIPTL